MEARERTGSPLAPKEVRVDLITALRSVTEGRMFVEVERARLTKSLAVVLEADGRLDEASSTLQEVSVETYGSMAAREKADFILEQVRLTHRQRDYVRMGIIANKISDKIIGTPDLADLQLRHRDLLIRLHRHRRQTLEMAQDYAAILSVPAVKNDPTQWRDAQARAAIAAALSPYDEEAEVLMHSMLRTRRLRRLPRYHALLKQLTGNELIGWPLDGESSNFDEATARETRDSFSSNEYAHPEPVTTAASSGAGTAAAASSAMEGGESDGEGNEDLKKAEGSSESKETEDPKAAAAAVAKKEEEEEETDATIAGGPEFDDKVPLLSAHPMFVPAPDDVAVRTGQRAGAGAGAGESKEGGSAMEDGDGDGAAVGDGDEDNNEPLGDAAGWTGGAAATTEGPTLWRLLKKRVCQHNLRVLARYYQRVGLERASELLGIPQSPLEAELGAMVSGGVLHARIDRPLGVVTFAPTRSAAEHLSDWSADLSTLLGKVERTTHLINKEVMLAAAKRREEEAAKKLAKQAEAAARRAAKQAEKAAAEAAETAAAGVGATADAAGGGGDAGDDEGDDAQAAMES